MGNTINYDLPVKDLIDELSATGHVTHKKYKKTSVTLHHNGGRLSHEGLLSVWRVRPASAQFDVDKRGDVAQFTLAREYAWACGNTEGNMRSIHIEMANEELAPEWTIGEDTWQGAARLAAWLFVHKVEGSPRPSKDNFFVHHHWLNTTCAGPYIDKIYDRILRAAQHWYDYYRHQKLESKQEQLDKKPTDSILTPVEQIQLAVGMKGKAVDGKWGPETDHEVLTFRKKHLIR